MELLIMSRNFPFWNLLGMATLAILSLPLIFGRPALAAQDAWPKRFDDPRGTVVMYQPQVEDFKDDKLTARAAVSVKTKDMPTPVFGAVWLSGRVRTDRDTRMATIDEVKVTDAKFPEAKPEQLEKLKDFLNTEMTGWSIPIGLDRFLAALEVIEREQTGDRGLKNDPPKIIFVSHPAVLVPLDGDPRLLPVPQSSLMRVANTPFLMLYDVPAKTYYLKAGEGWLAAADLKGPWKDLEQVPEPIKTLEATAQKTAQDKGASKKVEAKAGKMPEVIVSTVPAELLATDGEPQYTPIKGTNLLYLSNTANTIFMDTATQEYYALISGRWFKTKALAQGPWTYVGSNQLPKDFAKIPENSAKGFVLVNVADTPQAKEAVLDNSIPQTATIDRKKATTKVEYAGEPKFEQIPATDLEYAVNTGKSVFKEGTKYYALDQGVWYEAGSPNGPWQVTATPPKQVDKIPASNPHYNAKYVKVYDSTDDTVTTGYTPGYTGSYVDNGTVVYGTGYDYPAYATADTYIPPAAPPTYGYAAAYDPYASSWGYQSSYYNPSTWLGPGLVGAGAGMLAGYAIWGDHNKYGGGYWGPGGYNNVNIDNSHNNVINPRPGQRPPGWQERPGGRPGQPATLPANRANLYNRPVNDNRLASRPGQPTAMPVSGVAPGRPGQGPGERPGTQPARPGQAAKPKPEIRPAQAVKPVQPKVKPAGGPNNILADKNGNVYKRDNQGNMRPAAKPATRPAAASRPTPRPSVDTGHLNRDYAARQRGEVRTQNFQRANAAPRPSPSVSRPSGGGGAMRGGGGGGGGRGGGGGGRGGRR
jgi:hypothetical protein